MFIICSLSILVNIPNVVADNNTLIIRIVDVEWPPSCHISENYSLFGINVSFEITNSGQSKFITTPHSNLLNPFMIVDLEGFYAEYEGTVGLCVITNHTINTGITIQSLWMGFEIPEYNKTSLPSGKIIFWSDFDDTSHPYDVVKYETTIFLDESGMIIKESTTRLNINGFLIVGSLVFLVVVFYRTRKRN